VLEICPFSLTGSVSAISSLPPFMVGDVVDRCDKDNYNSFAASWWVKPTRILTGQHDIMFAAMLGGGPILAIEVQSQEIVDADAIGNSENVAIWKSTSDRRGRSVSRGTEDWSTMAVSLSSNTVKLYSLVTGQFVKECCKGEHSDSINEISLSGNVLRLMKGGQALENARKVNFNVGLCACPFSWGPAIGGEGVCTRLTLPNVEISRPLFQQQSIEEVHSHLCAPEAKKLKLILGLCGWYAELMAAYGAANCGRSMRYCIYGKIKTYLGGAARRRACSHGGSLTLLSRSAMLTFLAPRSAYAYAALS
ncbi:hypothetical protein Tco_0835091, partial [Tanacetum coccineum]